MGVTNQVTLKEARIAAGLSLQEVEDKTDYSVKRIAWLEENSEELTVGEMKEFCELYGVELDEVTFKWRPQVVGSLHSIATRITHMAEIKVTLTGMLMYVYDPDEFTVSNMSAIVRELISEIELEEEILHGELDSCINQQQSSLNTTLAGNC